MRNIDEQNSAEKFHFFKAAKNFWENVKAKIFSSNLISTREREREREREKLIRLVAGVANYF